MAAALNLSSSAVSAALSPTSSTVSGVSPPPATHRRALQAAAGSVQVVLTTNSRLLAQTPFFFSSGGSNGALSTALVARLEGLLAGKGWCAGGAVPSAACVGAASVVLATSSGSSSSGSSSSSSYSAAAIGGAMAVVVLVGTCYALALRKHRQRMAASSPAAIRGRDTPAAFNPPPPTAPFAPYPLQTPYPQEYPQAYPTQMQYPPPPQLPYGFFPPPAAAYPAAYPQPIYGAAPSPAYSPATLAPNPMLSLRRMESLQEWENTADTRLVDVDHEKEAGALFGAWPATCAICDEGLQPRGRVRLDGAGTPVCRSCACAALRSNPITPCLPHAVTMLDAVAELCEGSRHAPPGAPYLKAQEVKRMRDAITRDAHEHPARWQTTPCPNCKMTLQVPAAVHAGGGPIVCHECTHRVCTKCDVKFTDAVVPPSPGGQLQSHVGITCAQVAQLRAAGARLSGAEMQAMGVKACPFCGTLTSHFKGHACHHISPEGGCPGCHREYCYFSLLPWDVCRAQNHSLPQPHGLGCDARCDCAACPICKPGKPCAQCRGDERCLGCHPENQQG